MSTLRVTFDFYPEDGMMAIFKLFAGDLVLARVRLFHPETFKRRDYEDFIAGRRQRLPFRNRNDGTVIISWHNVDQTIRCEVSKLEVGGDGDSVVYFPKDLMIGPLQELASRLE